MGTPRAGCYPARQPPAKGVPAPRAIHRYKNSSHVKEGGFEEREHLALATRLAGGTARLGTQEAGPGPSLPTAHTTV